MAQYQDLVAELEALSAAEDDSVTVTVTGVIKPGAVLRYYDESSVQRTGIVRSTNVSMETFPELTQSLEVESHV